MLVHINGFPSRCRAKRSILSKETKQTRASRATFYFILFFILEISISKVKHIIETSTDEVLYLRYNHMYDMVIKVWISLCLYP